MQLLLVNCGCLAILCIATISVFSSKLLICFSVDLYIMTTDRCLLNMYVVSARIINILLGCAYFFVLSL